MSQKELSEAGLQELQFLGLVDMLSSTALAALGKLADPETGQPSEVDLDQARVMIDLLNVLQVKTEGNLTDRERRTLESLLTSLRLTYVDEVNRQKESGKDSSGDATQPGSGGSSSEPKREETTSEGFTDRRSGRE
jgi:hypothetical protein